MHDQLRSKRALRWLLLANVAATVMHYVDNLVFFGDYPEPPWMTPHHIDAFWFVMTPFALVGYKLIGRGFIHWGSGFLHLYAAMSLLVLAHYRYAPISSIHFRIHLFIVVEATLALALVAYGIALQARASKSSGRAVPQPSDDSAA
jgi:cation transport ATPase